MKTDPNAPPTLTGSEPSSSGPRGRVPRLPEIFTAVQLDTLSVVPLWRQLYAQIDEMLASGQLREGASLPPEREMAEALNVSRSTVKRSYDQLRHDQRLGGRGRAGSVIRQPPARARAPLSRFKGFAEEMRDRGKVATGRVVACEVVCDPRVASIFRRPPSAQFLHVECVRSGDDMPLARELAWYDLTLAPQMVGWDGNGSAYERLARQCALDLAGADQSVEAVLSSQADALAFGFSEPQPCLLIKRVTRVALGAPVEYLESTLRGDAYAYRIELLT